MVDFTTYNPPGVYVEDDSRPAVGTALSPGGSLVLVGPALGYKTYTETVRAYSTVNSATKLAQRGVYTTAVTGPPAIAAPVVKKLDGTVLDNTDYSFSVDTSGGGGSRNAVTSLVRLAGGGDPTAVGVASPHGVVDGDYVVVTYRYSDSLYFTPQEFDSFDQVADTYGEPLISSPSTNPNTSHVVSPLTMAAMLAFQNSASSVICLATNPSDGTLTQQFVAAYAKLVSDPRVGIIVPVFADGWVSGVNTADFHTPSAVQTYLTDLKAHLNTSASEGYGRMAMVGLAKAYDETTLAVDALAKTVASKRITLVFPNRMSFYNGSANQTTEVDGVYLAAALGAVLLVNPVARGLTMKSPGGFAGIPNAVVQRMTRSFKDNLSKNGVTVVQPQRTGALAVRHGVTTDMTSANTREISLVRIADSVFQSVQIGMEGANLIGEPIDYEMVLRVKGALQGILEQAKSSSVILDYDNLAVRQQTTDNGDPTVIECKFAYKPALPLNYITVSFTVDMNTGAVTTTENPTTG